MNNKLYIRVDSAQSEFRAAISTALAEALICGINECNEENMPLSELQQINLAKMSIMTYYTTVLKTEGNLEVEAKLSGRAN
jgi:hypothetical protein